MNPSGEISITIKDKSYKMRPSFKCLSNIEEATGCGVSKILKDASNSNIRYGHIAVIIYEAIRAGEDKASCPDLETIGEWLIKGQMKYACEIVLPFFVEALGVGPKEN